MEQKYFMDKTVHELHLKFIVRREDNQQIIAMFTSADRATEYLNFIGKAIHELKESY